MINLLPKAAQKKVITVYRFRVATVVLVVLAFTLTAAVALLIPSYVLTVSEEASVQERKAKLDQQINEKQSGAAGGAIIVLNRELDAIDLFSRSRSTVDVLLAVTDARPPGISIQSFSFEPSSRGPIVLLTGSAATRETLREFTEELKRLPSLSEVSLPTSNLTEAKNNKFAITATITPLASTTPQ